jgi:hypothetical protein
MEQRCSKWADFQVIWYLKIFGKYAEKIQDLLKSDFLGLVFGFLAFLSFLVMSEELARCINQISGETERNGVWFPEDGGSSYKTGYVDRLKCGKNNGYCT